VALLTAGLVAGGGPDDLRPAVLALERTPAALDLARARAAYGAALRRAGQRAQAREELRQALDLAYQCSAAALAASTHEELVAAGARPRTAALTGWDALTPSERRVAQMAAAGLTNREIAQALFVTPRTVEGHLTNVYGKLRVSSREELAGLVPDAAGAAAAPAG
jgi:DNA-binding CsgD family transcriptional regulator